MARRGPPLAVLVEDDPSISEMLQDVLRDERWEVVVAPDVASARRAFAVLRRRPNLVLLDQRLPDGRGLSLVLEVRRRYPRARVVMVTGVHALGRDLEGTLVDALFHKPIELNRFLGELDAAARPAPVRGDAVPG